MGNEAQSTTCSTKTVAVSQRCRHLAAAGAEETPTATAALLLAMLLLLLPLLLLELLGNTCSSMNFRMAALQISGTSS